MTWTPDPTFYPSPRSAAAAPPEELAYVVTLNIGSNGNQRPDALNVVDVKPGSSSYGTRVGRGDAAACPELRGAASGSDTRLRFHAIAAASRLGCFSDGELEEIETSDPDEEVRQLARRLLEDRGSA
jgi:hypothetical protein